MVDITDLDKRPLSKVVTVEGYDCNRCGKWEPVSFYTVSLYELLEKIAKLPAKSGKRHRLHRKAITKTKNLQERIRRDLKNGSSKHTDKTSS